MDEMSRKPALHGLSGLLKRALRLPSSRHAGIAVTIALSAPMLIAATGLSVDVGYWYQNQTSLQSAADAGALAAAMSDARLGQTTAITKASTALPLAKAAADSATNQRFGFATSAAGTGLALNVAITPNGNGTSTVAYTATAQTPRSDFFSGVHGMGLAGLTGGSQYASATASVISTITTTPSGCMVALGQNGEGIAATGGAKITATGCGVVSDSTAVCTSSTGSIALNPSAILTAQSVSAAGCVEVDTNGKAAMNITGASKAVGTTGQSDPYAALANAGIPPWPSMPPQPTVTNTFSGTYASPCGFYSGSAYGLDPCNYPNGISIANGRNLTFTSGSNSTPYGSTYNVAGGIDIGTGATSGTLDDTVPTTYYVTGSLSNQGVLDGWALALESPTNTVAGGTFYLTGGATVDGSNKTTTFGPGTYLASAYSGNTISTATGSSGTGAMYLQDGTTNFSGGTYYFDGGLTIGGSAKVTFGPGIYYFRNGDFTVANGGTLTANNATFVLEGNASYQFSGGTALNLSAPVPNSVTHPTNCVLPLPSTDPTALTYPQTAFSLSPIATTPSSGTVYAANAGTTGMPATPYPWDGTNGQGICGILIYQVNGDTTPDSIVEGASSTVNGIVYTPSAALNLSGTGSMAAASNTDGTAGTLAILANGFNLDGSASIAVAEGGDLGTEVASTSTTSTQTLLTQ